MNEPFAHNPEKLVRTVNLMAHPAASAMALSAVGFGLASHAVGSWMGAMAAAAEVSQRFWEPLLGGGSADAVTAVRAEGPVRVSIPEKTPKTERFAKAPAAVQPDRKAATIVALRRPTKDAKPAKGPDAAVTQPSPVVASPSAPAKIEKPARPDDLKAISGIGPKLEQVLNGLGIWTYSQVAAWGENDVAWVDDFLGSKGRVGRDGWIAQAATLAGTSKTGAGTGEQV